MVKTGTLWYQHIETLWSSFRKWYSNPYPEWKLLCFNSNFTEIYIQGSNYQYASIGSDNDLAPKRWLAIIWPKGGYWLIYASLGPNYLTWKHICLIVDYILLHVYSVHSTKHCINIYLHDMSSQWKRLDKICIHQHRETVLSRIIWSKVLIDASDILQMNVGVPLVAFSESAMATLL